MGEPLSWRVRHGYGLAALSIAIANTAVLFFLLKFLIDGAGLSPSTAGWVLLVGKVWDGVIDPLAGRLIDRTRSSWGARRPWLLGASVPFAALFAALWWPLPLTGWTLAVATTAVLVAYNTAYSLVTVPYGALTPALSDDYDERTRLNGARMTYSMIGGIVAGILFPMLLEQGGFWLAGIGLGALIAPPLWVTVWSTAGRDRIVAAPDEEPMWTVLRLSAFRRTAGLFLCAWTAIAVLSALLPFYVEHHLRQKGLLDAVFGVIQIAGLLAIPGVVWAAERFEKHRAYALGVGGWALVLLALSAVPSGTGTPIFALCVLAGPGLAAAHVLPWSMLPDVVEVDAAERGAPRPGAFYGVMTFLEQVGTAVALWSVGQILGIAGYVERAATQPESAITAIRLLIGPLPGVVLVAAALFAWRRPPLTRAQHRAIVAGEGGSRTSVPS